MLYTTDKPAKTKGNFSLEQTETANDCLKFLINIFLRWMVDKMNYLSFSHQKRKRSVNIRGC